MSEGQHYTWHLIWASEPPLSQLFEGFIWSKSLTNYALQRDYDAPFTGIPGHGRYQHFCVGGRDRIAQLLSTWPDEVESSERCRRLIDLFLVSVLLDAGAGTQWSYKSNENGRVYRRSEGIAVASLEMFKTVSGGKPMINSYERLTGLRDCSPAILPTERRLTRMGSAH